jgi:hypothetical protein
VESGAVTEGKLCAVRKSVDEHRMGKTLFYIQNLVKASDHDCMLQKFGKPVEPNDRRMSGERCGYLCAVAIANKLKEAWMSLLPYIPLCYIFVYYPNIGN